jgi:biopolymer transport protein ExbB
MKALAFTGGDWVIYILILCSILTVAIIVERFVIFSREKKAIKFLENNFARLVSQEFSEDAAVGLKGFSCLPARVLTEAMAKASAGVYIVQEIVTNVTQGEKSRLENRMMILNTLGNNAVYIGLFGTVLGVIKAFRDLSLAGGGGAEVVMQGFSEALVATAVGLMLAIPCVMAYNYFQKVIREIMAESDAMARLYLAKLKTDAEL